MTPKPTLTALFPMVLLLPLLSHVVKEVVHLKCLLACAAFAQALIAASRDGDSIVCWLLAVAAFVEHRLLSVCT